MISINLIPNFTTDDIKIAWATLLRPWVFWRNKCQLLLEKTIKEYLGVKHCFLFDSGRASFYFLLKGLGIGQGDEVIIQAFTCSVVPTAIINTGAIPVYVDINETYNIDPEKIEEKINSKTKVLVIQHTFGKPAEINSISRICRKHNLILIEDCAHGLGGEFEGRKLGSFGEAAFLSFGRDKVISGIWGGAVVTSDDKLAFRIERIIKDYPQRSFCWSKKQLFYVPLISLVIKTYDLFGLGKILHWLLKKTRLGDNALSAREKKGLGPRKFYCGLPEFQAKLVYHQLKKIEKIIAHRKNLAQFYAKELGLPFDKDSSYLRFTFGTEKAEEIRDKAKSKNIFLGDWYDQVVAPKGVDLKRFGYAQGMCPVAEKKAELVINLPTNPNLSLKEAKSIINLVRPIL